MEDFPSNSRSRPTQPAGKPTTSISMNQVPDAEEEVVYESVVVGSVKRRKKPLGRRIMDTFFKADFPTVVAYLVTDMLVPALQDIVINTVTQGIEKAITGEVRSPGRGASTYRGAMSAVRNTQMDYTRPSSALRTTASLPARRAITQPSSIEIEEFVLQTRPDVDLVVNQMFDMIRQYGVVSVAALYAFMGQTPTPLDSKFGWENLDDMEIRRLRNNAGWVLAMPPPIDIRP